MATDPLTDEVVVVLALLCAEMLNRPLVVRTLVILL